MVGNATRFAVTLPPGTLYVRAREVDGSGQVSEPSNEVKVRVLTNDAPSAPRYLSGLADGDALRLAWTNTLDGGPPEATVVDVSGSYTGSLPLGPAESFEFPSVPAGTYTFTVRATNAYGSSAPSEPVTLTFPGACMAAPAAPVDLRAHHQNRQVYLSWSPSPNGSTPVSYVIRVEGPLSGSFQLSAREASAPLPPGTYRFTIVAVNACGDSNESVMQTVTVP